MCLAFDALTLYCYAFAPDSRQGMHYDSLSELSDSDVRLFCNTLRNEIARAYKQGLENGCENPCYKYVTFSDRELVDDMLYENGHLMFVNALRDVIAVDAERLKDKPQLIEERYRSAYHDEVVVASLQRAKKIMRESVAGRAANASHAYAVA